MQNIIRKAAVDFDATENDLKPFHEGKSALNFTFSSAFSPPPQVTLNHHFLYALRGVLWFLAALTLGIMSLVPRGPPTNRHHPHLTSPTVLSRQHQFQWTPFPSLSTVSLLRNSASTVFCHCQSVIPPPALTPCPPIHRWTLLKLRMELQCQNGSKSSGVARMQELAMFLLHSVMSPACRSLLCFCYTQSCVNQHRVPHV